MDKDFSVGAVIKEASVVIRKNFWGIIGQYAFIMLITILLEMMLGNAGMVAGVVIGYALVKWALVCVEKGRVTFDNIFADLTFKKFIYYICTVLLMALAIVWPMIVILFVTFFVYGISLAASGAAMVTNPEVVGGVTAVAMLVSLIPLTLLYLPRMFAKFIAVEKDITPTKALRMSKKITKGVRVKLFGLLIVLMLVNVLGVLCLIIGIFYTAPLTAITVALVYKKLSREEQPQAEELPVIEEVIIEEVEVSAV